MAFNPDPKVRAAADFAKEFECDRVIIYFTKKDSNNYGYASYGETTAKYTEAKRIADDVFEQVGESISVAKLTRLDRPANTEHLTTLPQWSDDDKRGCVFYDLVLLAYLAGAEILDESRVLEFTFRELRAAEGWVTAIHLSASDNIIRKKRLQQPDCCVGVISYPPFDQKNEANS